VSVQEIRESEKKHSGMSDSKEDKRLQQNGHGSKTVEPNNRSSVCFWILVLVLVLCVVLCAVTITYLYEELVHQRNMDALKQQHQETLHLATERCQALLKECEQQCNNRLNKEQRLLQSCALELERAAAAWDNGGIRSGDTFRIIMVAASTVAGFIFAGPPGAIGGAALMTYLTHEPCCQNIRPGSDRYRLE